MADLTEEDLENISKSLDMSKELVLNMTEEEIDIDAFQAVIQKVELEIEFKTKEGAFLRSKNIQLCVEGAFLRLKVILRQIQIGFTFTLKDLEKILKIK